MILTPELLEKFNACEDGILIGNQLGCIGIDGKEAAKILEQNNHTDYANWVKRLYENADALKYSNYYKSIKYLVYDPNQHIYRATSTLESTQLIVDKIIEANQELDVSHITVHEEITLLDGVIHRFLIK